MSQSPSLQELLSASNDYALSNVYTAIPGIVISVEDMGECRLNVQPTINIRSESGDINTPRPPILNVPFQQPISQQGGLTYPIAPGNPVWLKFSMRGLEIWKRGSGMPEAPADMRRFDPRDCVAEPAYPFSMSPNQANKHSFSHDPNDVVLVHNLGTGDEVEIRLKKGSSKVEINCKEAVVNAENSMEVNTEHFSVNSSTFTVNSGDVSFNSGSYVIGTGTYGLTASDSASMDATFSQTGSYVLNGIALETHVHGGVTPGGADTGVPK